MKNLALVFSVGLALLAANTARADSDLVVTYGKSKMKGQVVNFDLQSDGTVTAYQFVVDLPKDASNIDLSKALSGLDKAHTGQVQAKGNRVAAVIYSLDNTPLPAGMQSIGVISYQSKIGGQPKISNTLGSNAEGKTAGQSRSQAEGLDNAQQ